MADPEGGDLVVLLQGATGFDPQPALPTGAEPAALAVADVDGNGTLDVMAASRTTSEVVVLAGDGHGQFGMVAHHATGAGRPHAVRAADVDRDGDVDLVVATRASDGVVVLLGDGAGAFAALPAFDGGVHPTSIEIDDFDRDGIADLAVLSAGQTGGAAVLALFGGEGTGVFAPGPSYIIGPGEGDFATTSRRLAPGDLDRDGVLDLVVSSREDDSARILLGDGTGAFQLSDPLLTGPAPAGLALADLDGDGRLDLVVSEEFGATVVHRGLGDGSFDAAPTGALGAGSPGSVPLVADLDRDGLPDLMVVHPSGLDIHYSAAGCSP